MMGMFAQGQKRSASERRAVRNAEVSGDHLAYVERGAGEPVVFVHGAVSDYRTWSPQLDALSEQYRTLAYSLRYHYPNKWIGHGGDYSRALHADDLIAFLRDLQSGPVHLIGHSYGGALAVSVANTHPELVRSLVLGEPSIFSILTTPEGKALLAEHIREFEETLQVFQRGEHERAIKEYLKIVVGLDVFDQLPAVAQVIIRDNIRTLGPMLRTFYVAPMWLRHLVVAMLSR
ncbi:MAG: alpha/beta fold hydrolase [Nitrospiraceae bacterium]